MKAKVPHTYEEAFAILDKRLKESERLELAKQDDAIVAHFDLGLWIRNNWIYGQADEYLCNEPARENTLMLPADMESSDMVERYQEYLRQKYHVMSATENKENFIRLMESYKKECIANPPEEVNSVSVCYKKGTRGMIECSLDVDGWYDDDIVFEFPTGMMQDFITSDITWMERIVHRLANPDEPTTEIEWESRASMFCYHELLPDLKHSVIFFYDVQGQEMLLKAYVDPIDFVRYFYYRLRIFVLDNQKIAAIRGLKVYSQQVESYFQSIMPNRDFEYKGFIGRATLNLKDLRYWGKMVDPKNPKKYLDCGEWAADNQEEFEERFQNHVDTYLEHQEYRQNNAAWHKTADVKTIASVFNIHPDKFLEIIHSGKMDQSLLTEVPGGYYKVPLPYVTKVWDFILNGNLEYVNWYWDEYVNGPDPDDYEDEDEEDEEERFTRSYEDAVRDNNRMKEIWKSEIGIDIDEIDCDFTQFNRHINPTPDYFYFRDVPEGLEEWIVDAISDPGDGCGCEHVSDLMEFAAYCIYIRDNGPTYD